MLKASFFSNKQDDSSSNVGDENPENIYVDVPDEGNVYEYVADFINIYETVPNAADGYDSIYRSRTEAVRIPDGGDE